MHTLSCDVLVAGGGPAGVPAAIAAARCGCKVILCQDRSVLGGNASSEVRMHIVGADASGARGKPLEVEAREGGIIEEIRLETAVRNPQRSPSMLDLVLYDLCRRERNLALMLNTAVVGVEMDGASIARAIAERPSTEDRFVIEASVFIDCTDDGRLGSEAGAPFRRGREACDEFDETMAEDRADNHALGSTLLFTARKHDQPMPFTAPAWVRRFTDADLKFRTHASNGGDHGLEYGFWWIEWGGTIDTIKDNETIRDELLAILLGVWDHIKNGGNHGADCWALDWFGFLPGKRESRRFTGQYILREDDVMHSTPFDDAIAFGGWPIDTHPPEGVDAPDQPPCKQIHVPHLFDVPLRSCVSRDVRNLMFAGRNISATHITFASTRVMATCAVIGQGVGTAAAFAAQHGAAPAELAGSARAIHTIQQRLLRDDAYLVGVTNRDEDDLARQATVRASSEQPGGEAANVLTGQTRAVHGSDGAPADRAYPGAHRWMSDPGEGLPSWLELSWDHDVRVGRIQFVFDTGMHRVLTLSLSDGYTNRMCWGRAQPETVRDYEILTAGADGRWEPIIDVTGNYQRVNRHAVDPPRTCRAIRIVCRATHGLDHARLVEVRVYEKNDIWPAVEENRDA